MPRQPRGSRCACVSDQHLTVFEGTGKVYGFGSSYPNRGIDATLEYDSCPDPTK